MKVHAKSVKMLSNTGNFAADIIIHRVRAAKRLENRKRKTNWKAAAATASDRRLLIGRPHEYAVPGSDGGYPIGGAK